MPYEVQEARIREAVKKASDLHWTIVGTGPVYNRDRKLCDPLSAFAVGPESPQRFLLSMALGALEILPSSAQSFRWGFHGAEPGPEPSLLGGPTAYALGRKLRVGLLGPNVTLVIRTQAAFTLSIAQHVTDEFKYERLHREGSTLSVNTTKPDAFRILVDLRQAFPAGFVHGGWESQPE